MGTRQAPTLAGLQPVAQLHAIGSPSISIPALPLSIAAFCGAKKCNPCLRKVLLGQGEWPVALQDTPDRDWKE
jgi:hypothetical protein